MKQKLRNTFFIMVLSVSLAFGQTAPDFTITDTDGVEHSLYADYLDQGKTVIIDLFFADCPPCHGLAPTLENIYQDWGAGQYDVQFIGLIVLGNMPNASALIDQAINNTGATHPSEITDVEDVLPVFDELTIFPNPVRDFASVNFNLNENADVSIQVFNMLGQSAMEVFNGNKYPGYHQVDFNPSYIRIRNNAIMLK